MDISKTEGDGIEADKYSISLNKNQLKGSSKWIENYI